LAAADPQGKSEPTSGAGQLPDLLRRFWLRSVGAFVLMFLMVYLQGLHARPAARFSPLVDPIFGDLLEYIPTFQLLHTDAFFNTTSLAYPGVAYPPFGAVLYALVYSVSRPVVLYLAVAALWMGLAVWGVRRALIQHGISRVPATLFPLSILVVSFPVAGLLQRGNVELFLWIFTATGVWAYLHDRDDAAAILWACAAAAKLYPIIFLVLLLPRRKYRAFLVGVASFVLISLASMKYLGPSIPVALHGSLRNVFGYQGARAAEWTAHDLGTNHSFFSLVKAVAFLFKIPTGHLTMPYYACGALVFAVVFFGRVRKMPVANQLLTVSLFMVMLPPISYFYTLVHLYAAWLVLVFLAIRADRVGVRIRGLSTVMLLFVPVFAAYTLLTYPGIHVWGGPVQALCLAGMFVCAVRFPFAEPVPA
jgi:hypothetical protein